MSVDRKMDSSRSKHSETEQRRRSKINERFQILRDLVPENDQKRDKASLLLEVIHYIHFLHEKLQMYEGTHQAWIQEPTKLAPWKNNSEQVESFLDQSPLERHVSVHDDDGEPNQSLRNLQNSVRSDLVEPNFYKPADNLPVAESQALPPLNLPIEASTYEGMSTHTHLECSDAGQLTRLSRSQFWQGRTCVDDCSVPMYNAHEEAALDCENGEPSISNAYSQGILNSLTNSLQSSGVDLSLASISVQLDIGKQADNGNGMTMFNLKENKNLTGGTSAASEDNVENYEQPHKRFRADQN